MYSKTCPRIRGISLPETAWRGRARYGWKGRRGGGEQEEAGDRPKGKVFLKSGYKPQARRCRSLVQGAPCDLGLPKALSGRCCRKNPLLRTSPPPSPSLSSLPPLPRPPKGIRSVSRKLRLKNLNDKRHIENILGKECRLG